MKELILTKNEIQVGKNRIQFPIEIFATYHFGQLMIIIFKGDYPQLEKCYNNAVAVNIEDGVLLWEVEQNFDVDYQNPYEGVHDAGAYLIFFKANSLRVYVNKNDGKILNSFNFIKKNRPY